MRIHQYVCNGKIGDGAEESEYKQIMDELSRCTSNIEIWTVANIELSNTQIDLMIIKKNGILCVDFKNYNGNIVGSENRWSINGEKIEKNWFKQAKIQRSSIGKKLNRILGRSEYFQSRQLMCVNRGSSVDIKNIDSRTLKWFGVITPDEICKEIKNYDSDQQEISKGDIKKILEDFDAESIDYEDILDEISESLPEKPSYTIADIRENDYKKIYRRLQEIHDNIIDSKLKWKCEYGLALTKKDARKTLEDLIDLYKRYPTYRTYGKHDILIDIFDYYFEYIDCYQQKEVDAVEKIFKNIEFIDEKYKIFKSYIRRHEGAEPPEFLKEVLIDFYKCCSDDPNVVLNLIKYLIENKERLVKEVLQKLLFDKKMKSELGIENFWDWRRYKIFGAFSMYSENEYFELLGELKGEYSDISEFPEKLTATYFTIKEEYSKAREVALSGKEKATNNELKLFYLTILQFCSFGLFEDDREKVDMEDLIEPYEFFQEMISLDASDCWIYETNCLIQNELIKYGYKNIDIGTIERDLKKGVERCESKEMYYMLGHTCKEHDKECAIKQFRQVLDVIIAPDEFWIDFDDEEIDELIPRFWRWGEVLKEIKRERRKRKLDGTEKSSLNELINLYVELERFKELYFIVEKLKEVVIVDEDLYSFSYKRFGEWLLNNYSPTEEEKKEVKKEKKILLEDVVLDESIKQYINFIIKSLEDEKKPQSLLLHGPPGCGKTMLAEAIANELSYEFSITKPSDILSKYIGESEQNIKSIFENARKKGNAVIFLDEMESYTFNRFSAEHFWETTLQNTLMKEIEDLLKSNKPILLIGATNYIEKVDPALKRSGRFNFKIEIVLPDRESRKKIFQKKLHILHEERGYEIDMDKIDFNILSKETEGLSGSDIKNIVIDKLPYILFKHNNTKEITTDLLLKATSIVKEENGLENTFHSKNDDTLYG